eukprot:TRINITY_DN77149_c0_g1_i1.p1 TRINITY_DN77149_c0_g1~~TRINITY_DN77149_c0_g1_i1.p1  ORF type:complete len:581 (-),score=82.56 TRINITY_DN77149_c0_g1_i1:92-1834(-)
MARSAAVSAKRMKLQDGLPATLSFRSRRATVYGSRGMVATSQIFASEAGLRILKAGGTAADACVAAAAALNVTEPCSTGIGGDAFALFYDAASKRVECLQGCGRSPAGLTLEAVRAHPDMVGGDTTLPVFSALTVNVPGAAAAWESAVNRWGKLGLSSVLEPAIELAEEGFAVQPSAARSWSQSAQLLRRAARGAATPFLPGDKAPRVGEVFRNPDLGQTFRLLAEKGARDGFYRGRVADAIVQSVIERGGVLSAADLAAHETAHVEPISTSYRGKVRLWECPPPTHAVVALMALDMLEQEPVHPPLSFETLHAQSEALRLGFADALQWCADPGEPTLPEGLSFLDKPRATKRWKQTFSATRRADNVSSQDATSMQVLKTGPDTVYLCAADRWGNACSFINSNYCGFGTGIVPEACGFTLQNRGSNFLLCEGHPNCLGPRKFPYHTIIPGMATVEGSGDLFCAMGVMGGFMQPQGHVQVLASMVDHGLGPQEALDQPRFCLDGFGDKMVPESINGAELCLEEGIDDAVERQLRDAGHRCRRVSGWEREVFGKGQVIYREPDTGTLVGGTEPRADGAVLAW